MSFVNENKLILKNKMHRDFSSLCTFFFTLATAASVAVILAAAITAATAAVVTAENATAVSAARN